MADIPLLFNYKGAAYPVEYRVLTPEQVIDFPTLVDLCCVKITLDASTTRKAVHTVPNELCYSLMKAALSSARDRAIEVLISQWPWAVLPLRKFAPALFDSIRVLHNDTYLNDRIRKGVKYTTCLTHTFVECLKKRAPTGLRCLDLSGYPSAEVIVNYLSSHVLLVYNEARQREIITMYNEVTRDLPDEKRQRFSLDSTLPDESYIIILDAFLQTADTHMELCRALKTSKSERCRFRLQLNKLDIMCLGVARISVLLEQIDPQYLTGLCLQFNGLSNDGMVILGPSIQQFTQLTALDLSCNSINISGSQAGQDTTANILADMLKELPRLARLDLSNNRTKHKLEKILSGIPNRLEYLKLSGCGMSEHDILYLKRSHHLQALCELDISNNNLQGAFRHVLSMLQQGSATLTVLEMEETDLEETSLYDLCVMCEDNLQNLRFLNLCRNNQFTEDPINYALPRLVKMLSLQVLKISYPVECYVSVHAEEVDEAKIAYCEKMMDLVGRLCEKENRCRLQIIFMY